MKKKLKKGKFKKVKKAVKPVVLSPKRMAGRLLLEALKNKAVPHIKSIDADELKEFFKLARVPKENKVEKIHEFLEKLLAAYVKRLNNICKCEVDVFEADEDAVEEEDEEDEEEDDDDSDDEADDDDDDDADDDDEEEEEEDDDEEDEEEDEDDEEVVPLKKKKKKKK